jgi:hypothetical protein
MINQLSHANLFSDLSNVRRAFKTNHGCIMEAHGQNSSACPGCQSISRSRHSRYLSALKDSQKRPSGRRHAGDPPVASGSLALPKRRLRVANLRRTSLQGLAQHTKRTGEVIAAVWHALGGHPGLRLMSRLGMQISADPLSRQVKRAAHLSALPISASL